MYTFILITARCVSVTLARRQYPNENENAVPVISSALSAQYSRHGDAIWIVCIRYLYTQKVCRSGRRYILFAFKFSLFCRGPKNDVKYAKEFQCDALALCLHCFGAKCIRIGIVSIEENIGKYSDPINSSAYLALVFCYLRTTYQRKDISFTFAETCQAIASETNKKKL